MRPRAGALAAAAALLAGCAWDGSEPDAAGPSTPVPSCEDGWTVLLDDSARSAAAWRMAGPGSFERQDDGTLETRGGLGLLWHPALLTTYELEVTWQVEGDDNSGVFVGFPDPGSDPQVAVEEGLEVQIDATDEPDRTTGALYGVAGPDTAARDAALNPPGEWNTFTVVVEAERVRVSLNGEPVLDHRARGSRAWAVPGHVGLQNHGPDDAVRFRDVRVRALDPAEDACTTS